MAGVMFDEMQAYLAGNGGRWVWGRCDCVGLLLRLASLATGKRFHRSNYIDERLDYARALTWLADLPDPMKPYIDLLERDAGFEEAFDKHAWDVSVIMTKKPLMLSDRRTAYPTDTAPGVLFHPKNMEACVMHRRGFSPVHFSWGDIARSRHYRLFGD